MAAKEDPNTITILIINHNDWTTQQIPLSTQADIHILTTIPPHTLHYSPTPKWPKYYHHIEPLLTSIICIHNQANLTPNLQTPSELTHVLQHTTNTTINTYPIKPTMPHYNIKFLHTWKTNLNNNTPTTQDTSLVNCQTNITNNTPLKSPHNNVYTQMSHLSPQS